MLALTVTHIHTLKLWSTTTVSPVGHWYHSIGKEGTGRKIFTFPTQFNPTGLEIEAVTNCFSIFEATAAVTQHISNKSPPTEPFALLLSPKPLFS